ncbi:MAG: TolC family protein [Parafilimonas sp.]
MKFFFSIFLCIFSISLRAQEQWDLRQCVEYAMQNNISVKQADVQARIAALQVKQTQLSKIPTANFTTDAGLQFGRSIDPTSNQFTTSKLFYNSYGLQGGAEIYNFGRLKNATRGAQFNAEAALADVEKAANDVALSVATYYLQVLASNEQIEISNVQIAQTREQYNVTKKKTDAGALPELNLAELEAQLSTDSVNLVTAKLSYEQNILSLKALLNIDAGTPFDVTKPPVELIPLEPLAELEPETVYQLAITSQPLQRATALRIKGAEKYILSNKAAMLPSLTGSYFLGSTYNNQALGLLGTTTFTAPIGTVEINGTKYEVFSNEPFTQPIYGKTRYPKQISQNFSQSVGINLNIPIFNKGNARLTWQRSKLDLESLQLQQAQNDQTLKTNIYTAYTSALAAMQKYYLGETTVGAAQKAYDFASKRYEVGLLSTIDLLITQNKLLTAKLQQVANHYDYVFKMKVLEFYKGQGIKL